MIAFAIVEDGEDFMAAKFAKSILGARNGITNRDGFEV